MKTLNLTLRTIMLAFALIGSTISAMAYDMSVNGVCYNITGNEAIVTYKDYNSGHGVYSYNYGSKYSGHVTIPDKVTYNGLTYNVTAIGEYAFANCTNMTSVAMPRTITTINSQAFRDCDKLVNVNIPSSVTSIKSNAFFDCDGLTSIVIPDSVTSIGLYAFQSCDKMINVTIGSSVTSIANDAFSYTPLSYITCLAETPPSLNSSYSYFSSYANTTLYVPAASIEAYRTASVWQNFKIITDFKPNYLSLDDVTAMHGDTIVVPVMMENENEITAFQTDIYMVDGFELLKVEDEYQVELSERKGRDHVIMASETPDGAVRVASYSPSLKTYKGTEGALFYLTIKVPDNGNGVYPFTLKSTRLTTIDEDEVLSPDASCNINVLPFILGDVDGSGEITVTDVVQTARYILYQNPEPFIFDAADMNGDGRITITDVVKIANLVLDAEYDETTPRLNSPIGSERMGGEADHESVGITLDNSKKFTAFQLDINLPEGMAASDFALTERANGLDLIVKDKGNGKIRLMSYSPNLKTIQGQTGNLLTFQATGCNEIVVNHIELVSLAGETIHPTAFTIKMDQSTAVKNLTETETVDHIDYFNLAGQRIKGTESGVTLVVTTHHDGTRTVTKVIH